MLITLIEPRITPLETSHLQPQLGASEPVRSLGSNCQERNAEGQLRYLDAIAGAPPVGRWVMVRCRCKPALHWCFFIGKPMDFFYG